MQNLRADAVDPVLTQTLIFGVLMGYGLSALLGLLLAILVWQLRGPGRAARVLFALCGLTWAATGLTRFALTTSGFSEDSALPTALHFFGYSAAALWPISLPLLWQSSDDLSPREKTLSTWLVRLAVVSAVILIGAFVYDLPRGVINSSHGIVVAYNAALFLTLGVLLTYRHLRTRAERIAVIFIVLGPILMSALHAGLASAVFPESWYTTAVVLMKQSMVLTFMGGLFYFGRFRTFDRFAKLGLRIALGWFLAVAAGCAILEGAFPVPPPGPEPSAVSLVAVSFVIALAILAFTLLGYLGDALVDRRVFGRIDPDAALTDLRERLFREENAASVLAMAERFVRDSLRVNARIVPRDIAATIEAAMQPQPRCGAKHCDMEQIGLGTGESQPLVMIIAPEERHLLVSAEMSMLTQAAQLVGRRLEGLEREQERLERSRREAALLHQLVEAELRALRAQINPHFLFNSLNTIASLVHEDPSVAERMAVRLARIFRHVLAQTDRPFSTVREEVDFLRAYLDIEQIRFGDRLKVDFRVADALADVQIPSLILQPLVENAIKHGLSPKVGPCRLVISGAKDGEHLVLAVEDDGVGAAGPDKGLAADTESTARDASASSGIGLRNVNERLRTLYGDRGRLQFETRARIGSRAAIFVPLPQP